MSQVEDDPNNAPLGEESTVKETTPQDETTTPTTAITPSTPDTPSTSPTGTGTTPTTIPINITNITNNFNELINQFFGFFKDLDGPKFFIVLGLFLFIMTLFWGKGKIAGLPAGMLSIIGFLLVIYGGMQKYKGQLPGLG